VSALHDAVVWLKERGKKEKKKNHILERRREKTGMKERRNNEKRKKNETICIFPFLLTKAIKTKDLDLMIS
jgi:hypothetical protein